MKQNKLLPLGLMVALAIPNMVKAEQSADEPLTLDKVLVTSPEPLPNSQAHVREDTVKALKSRTSDTASMLQGLPGVSLYGAGGVSSLPVIRGLADDRLRVKVDGMDLISACANHMNPPLSYMSTDRVNELKVYPGIAPVSVGGDSIGGTILAESSKPEFATSADEVLTKGEVGAFYRSNGDARGANVSATVANQRFSLKYNSSTSKANNYDAGDNFKAAGNTAVDGNYLNADEVGSSSYENRNHAFDLGMKLNEDHILQLRFAHQDIPYQGWPNQRMDMVYNRSNQLNLTYNGDFDWGSLQSTVYREKTHHKMQFGEDKQFMYGTAPGMPMRTEGDNRGLSIKGEIIGSERDLFRVGAMMQRYRLDDYWEASGTGMMMSPNTFQNINNGERDRYGVFAEWEANWNAKWMTLAGIRHETVKMDADEVQGYSALYQADADAFNNSDRSHTDNNLDLTLLAKFTRSPTETYEFGYAQKTRSPNLYERYAWSTTGMAMRMVNLAGDGNGYVGNVNLDPEEAHTLSFTADWHDAQQQDWAIAVTPYISYVDDFIDAERCSGGGMMSGCTTANLTAENAFVYLQYANVSAKLYGIDVSAQKKLHQSDKLGAFRGEVVVNYVRGKNRDIGDDLYNIMPLNTTLSLHHTKDGWQNTVEWELVSSKDKVNDERNEQETAGYGLLNIHTGYQWKSVRIDVGVENVFDKLYSQPLSGAYTGQGATMSGTAVPWGITVPGMGRSFYTGINYQF